MELTFKKADKVPFEDDYPTQLQLYPNPPTYDISLEEFNELATIRQRVLQDISNLRERHIRGDLNDEDYKVQLREKIKLQLPLSSLSINNISKLKCIEERRRDHISHYILRLAYCETEDLRRWFMAQEVELLRYRLSVAGESSINDLITSSNSYLPLAEVTVNLSDTADDKDKQLKLDIKSFYMKSNDTLCKCYKVHFTEVLDLVQKRAVVVKNGYAYLPVSKQDMLIALICNKFRSMLSQDLVRTVAYVWKAKEDERVGRVITNLKTKYLGEDFSNSGTNLAGQISIRDLDTVCKESFSPCMRHLHESLRQEHHMRHFGRLQYGLFLKSIGITLDQALAFWREEFTKKMDPEKFDKQYAYNIRHNYGKEGKRTSYTPYSCMKIITTNAPSTGEHHGCPFRHWDNNHVHQMLISHGLSMKFVHQVEEYSQKGHYQLACQKYFEITHGINVASFSLEHPTQYFIESRRIRSGDEVESKEVKMEQDKLLDGLSEEQLAELVEMDTTI